MGSGSAGVSGAGPSSRLCVGRASPLLPLRGRVMSSLKKGWMGVEQQEEDTRRTVDFGVRVESPFEVDYPE